MAASKVQIFSISTQHSVWPKGGVVARVLPEGHRLNPQGQDTEHTELFWVPPHGGNVKRITKHTKPSDWPPVYRGLTPTADTSDTYPLQATPIGLEALIRQQHNVAMRNYRLREQSHIIGSF